ncbi:phytanoyl-CoA 2-hydroxylase in complex with iron and 2-Oxoglutarate [Cladochytrium replicatum]|nr:phytanoyl-CoA 2-hydroxylase in complex with iron and 2-Oxoglutarate [Cladochytrium replicatum]
MSASNRISAVREHIRPLKYTLTPHADKVLTPEQRAFYEENGYFLVKKLVPEVELQKYKRRFIELAEGTVPRPITMLMMKDVALTKEGAPKATGEAAVTKIQDFQDDEVLAEYFSRQEILRYVEAFTGPDIMAMHTMLINKPPNVGESGRHPLHQDLHYFPFRPADRIVCSWTAIENVTRANGCLVVLPGTHKGELLHHGYPEWESGVNKMYHGVTDLSSGKEAPRVYAEMEPGDTIFFHPLLIHGSGANRTQGYRKAISCHYASSFCEYVDVKGTLQEEIAKEVEEIAKRKAGGMEVPFQAVWQIKGRLVKGNEGTMA